MLASTALGGILGVLGTFWNATRDRARADREEWFRRVQWAQGLTTTESSNNRVAGYRMLDHLSTSPMATSDDRALLMRLTSHPALEEAEVEYERDVDATQFVEDTRSGTVREAR